MLRAADIFTSGMMLQREKPIRIRGTAERGEQICVTIQGKHKKTITDDQGNWNIELDALQVSGQETLTIQGADEVLVFEDVAVGDIYIAAGQSNMEFWMRYEPHFKEALKECDNSLIRFYDVPKVAYVGQEDDFDYSRMGIWRKATEEDLEFFSAVGYYFARELENELSVPIGIIGCNWGGTRSSAWMTKEHAEIVEPEQVEAFQKALGEQSYEAFCKKAGKNPANDSGKSSWDAFTEFILPGTPSQEEIDAFYGIEAEEKVSEEQEEAQPQAAPGCLFQNMVLRIAPFSVRGVLWYQGESDDEEAGAAFRYKEALGTIMGDWRRAFLDEKLPFFIVQLPGFRSWLGVENRNYSIIRQKQQEAADADEHAYLCSISDAGEEFDIHPKNKKIVGIRLALLALKYLYDKDVEADPPRLRNAGRTGREIYLTFENAGAGLTVTGEKIDALHILADGREIAYTWEISGEVIRIEIEEEFKESAIDIRFAKEAWYKVNLYNDACLPAIPFEVICEEVILRM